MFDWRRSSASLSRKPVSVIAGESTITFPSWYALVLSPALLLHPKQRAWQKSCFATGQLPPKRSPLFMLWGQLHLLLCFLEWMWHGHLVLIHPRKQGSGEGWLVVVCCTVHSFLRAQWRRGRYAKEMSGCSGFMPMICTEVMCSQKSLAVICAAKTQPWRVSSWSLRLQLPL